MAGDLRTALRLEWKRKIDIDEVHPGMSIAAVKEICGRVAAHNQEVARLARFWELLIRTVEVSEERSAWLELRREMPPSSDTIEPAIRMAWRDEIHSDWRVPTLVLDATMPVEIVRQFFPQVEEPRWVSAPMPHARVRQIADRPMTADMLIPTEGASDKTNATRTANVERVRRFLEVRADVVRPGKVLVICQLGLEAALVAGELPANVDVQHFNNITGENAWSKVTLVVVIGRTEPAPAKGASYPGEHAAIVDQALWDKVHAVMQVSPRSRAAGTRRQTPALLKGLIFGPSGTAMTPTATKKGSRLYRYYASMDVIRGRAIVATTAPLRLPAEMVENAVIQEIGRLVRAPEIVVRTIASARQDRPDVDEREVVGALRDFDAVWTSLFLAEQARVVRLLVERVTITGEGIAVDLRTGGLASIVRDMLTPHSAEAVA